MTPFSIIVAMDSDNGIGKNGTLPWHLPEDLKHFKETTLKTNNPNKKNAVIMGRKTWESLPEKFRPLPGRINIVLTRNKNYSLPEGVFQVSSFSDVLLKTVTLCDNIENIFIIGGGEVFKRALNDPACKKIYATRILSSFNCDTFFPDFKKSFQETAKSATKKHGSVEYYFAEYTRFGAP